MTSTPSAPIFQASDLNRRGKAVFDAARAGRARIRDADGNGFVMLSEAHVIELETLSNAAVNLATVERARSIRDGAPLDLSDFGEWTWLRQLEPEDLAEFVTEVREALIHAVRELDTAPLTRLLYEWRTTARELEDPERRAVLLGSTGSDDVVEALRPEATPDP